jgi:adenylosuccinate lyase
MVIHPIEYRYGMEEMKFVWSEANRVNKLLMVEAAPAKAEADLVLIPKKAADIISESTGLVELDRVKEMEMRSIMI